MDAGVRRGTGRTGNRRVLSRGSGRGDGQMGACAEPLGRVTESTRVSRSQSFCGSGRCDIGVLTSLTLHPARGTKSHQGHGRQGKGRSCLSPTPRGLQGKPSPLPKHPLHYSPTPTAHSTPLLLIEVFIASLMENPAAVRSSFLPAGNLIRSIN